MRGSTIAISHIFIIAMEILSQLCAFDESSAPFSLPTFCLSISTFSRTEMHLGRKFGRGLPVQHCSTKKSFHEVALACKFVMNSPFSNNGGILTAFFLLMSLFKMDQ